MDDLFQVGCIGLIKAVDNFNPELEVEFSTYAVPMILGEIKRLIRTNNSLRVSRSIRDTAYQVLKTRGELEKRDIVATPDVIAKELNIPTHYARIHSSDVFYREGESIVNKMYNEKECVCVEMESFALFHNAKVLNKKITNCNVLYQGIIAYPDKEIFIKNIGNFCMKFSVVSHRFIHNLNRSLFNRQIKQNHNRIGYKEYPESEIESCKKIFCFGQIQLQCNGKGKGC